MSKEPKAENRIKADYIQLFPTKWMKHKKKIDSFMKKINKGLEKEGRLMPIIWGFGDHYKKDVKGQSTYYICFSNDATKSEELRFYVDRFPDQINNFVYVELKKAKLID